MDSVLDSIWKHCRQAEQLYSFKIPYCDGIGSSHKHDPWLSVFRAHPAFLSNPELSFPFYPLSLSPHKKKPRYFYCFSQIKGIPRAVQYHGTKSKNHLERSSSASTSIHIYASIHPSTHPRQCSLRSVERRCAREGRAVWVAVLESSVDDLTLKNLAQDPGALARDAMPGYRDVAHSGRHTHARGKATESQAGRARPAMVHASLLHVSSR